MSTKINLLKAICVGLCLCGVTQAAMTLPQRKQAIIDAVAAQEMPATDEKRHADIVCQQAIAHFEKGNNVQACQLLISACDHKNASSMFWWYYALYNYKKYYNQMDQATRDRLKQEFTTYTGPISGSTENHKVMFTTAFTLARETWPNATFNHKKPYGANDPTGKQWLMDWMQSTVLQGFGESDSEIYAVFYYNCYVMLAEFADDPALRQMGKMAFHWLLLNTAPHWLKGYNISPSPRSGRATDSTAGFENPDNYHNYAMLAWYYFGGEQRPVNLVNDKTRPPIMCMVSSVQCPDYITRIATERSVPYFHRETHVKDQFLGARRAWYKSTWMTPEYGLCGQKDLAGASHVNYAGQMIRWYARWVSDSSYSSFSIFNPQFDVTEHAGRWAGRTKYEQVFHWRGSLIGVLNIFDTFTYNHLVSILPKAQSGIIARLESDGWLLLHGGKILIGAKLAKPYTIADFDDSQNRWDNLFEILTSAGTKNGYVVQTASPADYAGATPAAKLQAFKNDLVARTVVDFSAVDATSPSVRFKNLDGDEMTITYTTAPDGDRKLNGTAVDYYNDWPLVENPWSYQKENDPILRVVSGSDTVIYNFQYWSITSGDKVPDLIVDSVLVTPVVPVRGEAVSVSAVIRNVGSVTTQGPVSVRFVLRGPDGIEKTIGTGTTSASLASMDRATVMCASPFIAGVDGTYQIRAHVDPQNAIVELSDDNNTLSSSFVVAPLNLALNKPVSASSQVADWAAPVYAVDNNQASRWEANVLPAALTVDLEQGYSLSHLVMKMPSSWATAREQTTIIEGSLDGVAWVTLAESLYIFRQSAGNSVTVDLDGARARYVRLTISAAKNGTATLAELELYEKETAVDAKPPQPSMARAAHGRYLTVLTWAGALRTLIPFTKTGALNLELLDMRGRLVASTIIHADGRLQWDISSLRTGHGAYLLRAHDGSAHSAIRFVGGIQ